MKSKLFFTGFFLIFLISNLVALSNESIQAENSIKQAEQDILDMAQRNIPINRVNETYQEAIQLYSAQKSYETSQHSSSYKLVLEKTSEISNLKEISFIAQDELNVFIETYQDVSKEISLFEMQVEYEAILDSFNSERFEETNELIDEGYNRISEIQSKQTAIALFYETTSKTIKSFFKQNWKKLLIGLIVLIILFFIFGKTLLKYLAYRKLKILQNRRRILNELIKKAQYNYFDVGSISQSEYTMKLGSFTEMIRDIDREIPLLNEKLMKLSKNKSFSSIAQKNYKRSNLKKIPKKDKARKRRK